MGLDTSHDCWHGSYGAFSRWRNKVAEAAGYMVGSFGGESMPRILLDWGHVTQSNLLGEWDDCPRDPLIFLIAHADDEGVIHPAQAGPLADRLAELLPKLDGISSLHLTDREKTQQFIDGLRAAVAAGEDVDFH